MKRYVNQTRHPVVFEDGTILAAAGTDGCEKEFISISDPDRRRYIESGLVVELDAVERLTSQAPAATTEAPAPALEIEPQTDAVELGGQRHAGPAKTRKGGEA
jgi:hypothetical protein